MTPLQGAPRGCKSRPHTECYIFDSLRSTSIERQGPFFMPTPMAAKASRVMNAVITPEHKKLAGRLRELMAKYEEVELLVKIGEYKRGGDPTTDEAIDKIEAIRTFLRQRTDEHATMQQTLEQLSALVGSGVRR